MTDCPKDIIEVRRHEDGTLDEIVAGDPKVTGVVLHIEQMDSNRWGIGIYHGGYRQVVWLSARGKIHASSEMDDDPDPIEK